MNKARFFVIVLGLASVTAWGLVPVVEVHHASATPDQRLLQQQALRRQVQALRANPDVFGFFPTEEGLVIVTDRPATIPLEIGDLPVIIEPPPELLPPPPGVILLDPDGTQAEHPHREVCPPGYTEVREYRWRFCNNIENPQPIPSELMALPIAGIPYIEAQ